MTALRSRKITTVTTMKGTEKMEMRTVESKKLHRIKINAKPGHLGLVLNQDATPGEKNGDQSNDAGGDPDVSIMTDLLTPLER
jgi:hypothetical protein